jgi:hypothetical protein
MGKALSAGTRPFNDLAIASAEAVVRHVVAEVDHCSLAR